MSLAKALKENQPRKDRHPCLLGSMLSQLSPEDQQAFEVAVKQVVTKVSGFTQQWLLRVLEVEKLKVSTPTLKLHISKKCGCYDTTR